MIISLLDNVQSGQEPKARVKDTTDGAIARDYRCTLAENDMAKLKPESDNERADCAGNSEVSNVAYWPPFDVCRDAAILPKLRTSGHCSDIVDL
jgi:hypothetical protein